MKSISDTLLQAQISPHRLPYIEAEVHDLEQGINRLAWTTLYQGNEPDNHHGIAFDGEGAMHRIRADVGDTLYYQKVARPDEGSDYSRWTQIASDCAGPCAIAARGAMVYIFYRTTGNLLWKYYSHDHGDTWNSARLSNYSDVTHLAASWRGNSESVVCFALKLLAGTVQFNAIVLDTITQQTTEHPWSDAQHTLIQPLGIGATYDAAIPGHALVCAGKQQDSPYHHYDLFRTHFSDNNAFTSLRSFLMAPEGEGLTYEYPDCHLPREPQEYETNRIVAVEKFTGTSPFTRPVTCHMVRGTRWSDTTFTEPRPFLDAAPSCGLKLQSTSDYWWLSCPRGLWRAPRLPRSPLTLSSDAHSGRILALTQFIQPGRTEAALILTLDNSTGQYASPGEGVLSSLRLRSEVRLKLGYTTAQGKETIDAGTYWIDSWQYSTSLSPGGKGKGEGIALFRLYCLDGWGLMRRWTARYQMRWNKDQVAPTSVWQILYQLLARVGIRLSSTPPRPQSPAINSFYPDFTISPGTPGNEALATLLSFVPDQLVFAAQEAFTTNPLPQEESCYCYGTEHRILEGNYAQATTVSRVRAIGRDASASRIVEEALDSALISLGIDILEQDYDPNLDNATRAKERAEARLRKHALSAAAEITIPTNVAQELYDVVTVTDPRCNISWNRYRISAIKTLYQSDRGIYQQVMSLCHP